MELLTRLTNWLTPTTLFLLLNFTIGTIFFTNRFGSNSKNHAPAPLARAPSLIDRVKSINFHLYNYSPSPPESEIHFSGSDPNPNPPPSLLVRVKSFKMPYFKFPQHNSEGDYAAYELMTRPEETNRVDIKIAEDDVTSPEPKFGAPSLLQRVKSIKLPSLYRSEPDPIPPARTKSESSTPVTKKKKKKVTKKMTKSASAKCDVGYIGREEETIEAVEKRRPETMRVERTTSIGEEGEDGVDDKASNFINKFKQQLKLQRLDSFLRYREMLKND
ncbi:Pathogen-associated molecular patterns-induced protein A70 [Cardamine amara subsp. amara]|uniref:Pathogen-associated molecular patterns-induced protein A70 n=1 Tax=Cardamine amara subsp. amara TaxID=228776 RepID=A0ABD1A7Z2_CARAN